MDKPFYPDGEIERYILLIIVHHPRHNDKTMSTILNVDPVPCIESMASRGLSVSKENGLYSVPDNMRRCILAGLELSRV